MSGNVGQKLKLVVGERVGPFVLGQAIAHERVAALGLSLSRRARDEATGWVTWELDGHEADLIVHTEDNRIVDVTCYASCLLGYVELIGANESTIRMMLGEPELREVEDVSGRADLLLHYDARGLLIWLREQRVYCVQCGLPEPRG